MSTAFVQAQVGQLETLPRPSIYGTWRVVGIDQRRLKRPVIGFNAIHFDSTAYLPIGTTFSLEDDGPWGSMQPARMVVLFKVSPPVPRDACPEPPAAGERIDAFFFPLCETDGTPSPEGRKFVSSYVELMRIRERDGDEILEAEYLYELGYRPTDLYFYMGGDDTMKMQFIPYGPDTLLLFNSYKEIPGLDVTDPRQNFDHVLLVAERVKP